MSTCSGERVTVSTWGRYEDDDGIFWQRWSVRTSEGRVGYIELPPDTDSVAAMLIAACGWGEAHR